MLTPILVICLLIFLNAVFAMGEMALISAKRPRLDVLAKQGVRGATTAIRLAEDPHSFLPTVQVGMTLVSILEGTFGGSQMESTVTAWIANIPSLRPIASEVSIVLVVAMITFAMLVFGELIPKQIALQQPEAIASRLAWLLVGVARIAQPIVWLLSGTSSLVLRLLRVGPLTRAAVTEEELKAVLAEGARAGVLETDEQAMIERLLRLADRPVRAIMTPRNELFWIDRHADQETLVRKLRQSSYARIVVCEGDVDHPVGVILAKDIMDRLLLKLPVSVDAVLREPPVIPDSLSAQDMIERMRGVNLGITFVLDEYGSFEGIVTPSDVFEAIVGEEKTESSSSELQAAEGEDEYIFDGFMPADELRSRLDLPELPGAGGYHTLGGVMLALLRRVPARGDKVAFGGWLFEVLEMDRRRVGRVKVSHQVLAED
ncbi:MULTISPECIES: hemolysin family protein [Gluconobacter]|uniref:Hemolysin C n=7 Tax=Gluconobacter TaxID=441 RepID=A0A149UBP8_GLUOY|nr:MULTISPECIES: hemolysin family protein [Gluconobacter]AHK70623.1 putative hemolysin-like protein [Gluconobacter oxydans DSM 3504]KXU99599.1 hemolysin C [Gluconobacter potus]KXV08364.1 hemolysin C [Gluconobacter oxydans]KXV12419.1 hemolysin C [Gluconobacter oxydans]KXV18051.1 hemolysin C [Gluconobacter oxydans]